MEMKPCLWLAGVLVLVELTGRRFLHNSRGAVVHACIQMVLSVLDGAAGATRGQLV